ncbi:MAG: hypothetical protein HYX27_14605 [Acidobacteria bacterium]|nr:hypothetical protein [Acidobacteriota bacterium]
MGGWLLLFLLPVLGFAFARAVWPAPRRWSSADPIRIAVAPPIGFGIASGLHFALRTVLHLDAVFVIGAVVLVTACFAALARWRTQFAEPDAPASNANSAPVWLLLLCGAGVAMAFLTFLMLSAAAPHGEWDAWSIWNLRARFLFRAEEFVSPFSSAMDWAHPDYPLLMPGLIALLWHAAGAELTALAASANLLFLASAVAVPYFTLRLLRGSAFAALTALAILGATTLVRNSASQYADVPLAAYICIAGILLVYRLEVASAGFGPVFLAGLSAGFAAWTKNEGLLFCASLIIAFLVYLTIGRDFERRVLLLLPLAAGALAVLALVGHFKFRIAPPNDLVNVSNSALFGARMHDFNRYWVIFWAFAGEFLTFGHILLPPVIVFGVWFAIVRLRPNLTGAALLPLAIATLQLGGYFAIYLLTSKDLDWHLNTALPRLLLHVWPLAVTGVFLISGDIFAQTPQPAATNSRSK